MLTNETQQNVAASSNVTFDANTLTPSVGSSFTVSGNNGLELAAGQYLVTFVSDAGVTGSGTIGATLQLAGAPITAAETSLSRTDTVERIALNAIVTSTGGQTLTVVNNSGDQNSHENTVLTVVKLS